MPEFPEVHTIVKDLKKITEDALIKKIYIEKGYETYPDNITFKNKLEGKRVKDVFQIAKNILLKVEGGVLNFHLAMTGQILAKKTFKPLKHERVTFKIEGKDKSFYLAFRDVRKFGKVRFLDPSEYLDLREKYGPPPLSEELNTKILAEIIGSKNTSIKNLIMDQTKLAGLGNIYATEALFISGIHPETRTRSINMEQTEKLLGAIRTVIQEGIENRGSTLEDEMFIDIFGKKGQQQRNFRIYSKSVCPDCESPVKKKKISGRNTYFCSICQV